MNNYLGGAVPHYSINEQPPKAYDDIINVFLDGSETVKNITVIGFSGGRVKITMSNGVYTITELTANGTMNISSVAVPSGLFTIETMGVIGVRLTGNNSDVLDYHIVKAKDLEILDYLVSGATNLTNFSTVDIPKLNRMSQTFYGWSMIASIDLSSLTTMDKSVIFQQTFYNCTNLACITNLDTTGWTDNTNSMFGNTPSLLAPNSTEQAALMNIGGAVYNNPQPCP